MKIDKQNLNFLNQLSSEIILLDEELRVLWLNESALNKGWVLNKSADNIIIDQFSDKTKKSLMSFLLKALNNDGSKTKREFELTTAANSKRVIDLTVTWSNEYDVLILEILCTDNLNKIIDSTKTFSTQKIAANLARTLAHEVKNPLAGIKGSAQILEQK